MSGDGTDDWCDNCMFEGQDGDEYPCVDCNRLYSGRQVDHFREDIAERKAVDSIDLAVGIEQTLREAVQSIPDGTFEFANDTAQYNLADDPVNTPNHYMLCGVEAKDMIKLILNSDLCKDMTPWQLHCFACVLKYRFREGKKDNLQQDNNKANKYEEMFNA